jgi:hypothetical protein
VRVWFPGFLTSALGMVCGQLHALAALFPGGTVLVSRRIDDYAGLRPRLDAVVREILPSPGIEPVFCRR